ncbi:hypothetical protein ACFLU1_05145 [Chloroflexota bacterium]
MKEIVETHFNNEVVIIPGREFETGSIHFVKLDLPFNGVSTFRFLAHPGHPGDPTNHINLSWHRSPKRRAQLAH